MPPPVAPGGQYQMADRVVVKKSERRLYLMRANQIVAEYPIRLGLNPTGHKLREGDFRTPEGSYELVRRTRRASSSSLSRSRTRTRRTRRARSSSA